MVAPPSKSSRELSNAVYDDFKRKAIDAAKKRAVAQNVDYETFKNMVSVAHLRPLQAPNLQPHGADAPSWSFAADGSRVKVGEAEALASSAVLLSDTLPANAPSTSGDFARDWRRCCPTVDHKYRYLQLCGPNGLRAVFKVEVATDILRDVLTVLHTCWMAHAGAAEERGGGRGDAMRGAVWVAQVLLALSEAGRFGLSVKLLGSSGAQVTRELLSQLEDACRTPPSQDPDTSDDIYLAPPPDADTADALEAAYEAIQAAQDELRGMLPGIKKAYGV